jgi:hypothetical protein
LVTIRDSRPKMIASTSAPTEVTDQPTSEIGPKTASEAGSRKIPEPIMLPITSATAANRPSLRPAGGSEVSSATADSGTGVIVTGSNPPSPARDSGRRARPRG